MLSQRLKSARNRVKLTQEELAAKVNTTKSTISNYENGHSTPSNEMLVLLSEVLQITTDYLLGRTDTCKSERNSELPELSSKDEQDIARKLESILGDLDSESSLAFDGEPLDDVTRELVREQIESNLRLAKQLAKRKFTPKKYRD